MKYKVNEQEVAVETSGLPPQSRNNNNVKGSRRSGKEKTLIVIVILLVITVLGLIATVFWQITTFRKGKYREMCQTKSCIETAGRVLGSINKTIDPCDDFYEFACRGWITDNPIPRNRATRDPINVIRDEVQTRLHEILDAPDKKEDGRPIKLARSFYRTCMDSQAIEKIGVKPLHDTFKKLGLPLKPPTDDEAEDLDISEIVGRAQRYSGMDILIEMWIGQDVRNNSRHRIKLDQVSPSFQGLEIYLRDPVKHKNILDAYRKYINEMMGLAGVGNKSEEYTKEIMNFMTKISKIMTPDTNRTSGSHKIYDVTIATLQNFTDPHSSQWSWKTYLDACFNYSDVTIYPKNDTAVVIDMNYFKGLPILMRKTSPGILARYVWWEVYVAIAPQTTQVFRTLAFDFWKTVYGVRSGSPRWQSCTRSTNSRFSWALTTAFVEKYFSPEEKKKAMQMWIDVSTSFDDMLFESKWMDVGTKARAHKKLAGMRPFVAYPDWITDAMKLAKSYKETEVFEGRLFDTYVHMNLIIGRRILNSLREKPNRNKWITSGTTVNAFYSPTLNSVTFPVGILHTPLYGNGVEAVNYGAIGAVMGHELTHGFDNSGRKFDENGNIRQWWSKATLKRYLEKVDCMAKQYSEFKVTQLGKNYTINGVKTLGENIADNGGLREAFRAYKKLVARSKPQQSLPGLVQYTDEQLFFLGFAQMWCGSHTNGYLKSLVLGDEHAPNRYRVIGTLRNNAEFSKAWKCPRGSPMNPKHKCIVW